MNKKIAGIIVVTLLMITGAFLTLCSAAVDNDPLTFESYEYSPGDFLLTTQWGQTGKYHGNYGSSIDLYNLKLPWNISAGRHFHLGCWTVAIGQILRFHELQSYGEILYVTNSTTAIPVSVYTNMDNHSYFWSNLADLLSHNSSTEEKDNVSTLLYDVALTIGKDWPLGYLGNEANMLQGVKDHFCHISSSESHQENLPNISKIIGELDHHRPCVLFLNNIIKKLPHAMVLDGYRWLEIPGSDKSKFQVHLNLGWYGGVGTDGWYNYTDPVITIKDCVFDDPSVRFVQFYRLCPYFKKWPVGPDIGMIGPEYMFEINSTLSRYELGPIYYKWDWGDGIFTDWIGRYDSGETCFGSHEWKMVGNYDVRVKARDVDGWESDWSESLTIHITRYDFLLPILEFIMDLMDKFPSLEPLLTPIIELICS